MRVLPVVCLVVASLVTTGAKAHAERCRDLPAVPFHALSDKARARFESGEQWQQATHWKVIVVDVYLQRAPHLASTILQDCGAIVLAPPEPADMRRFSSMVQLRVTSWATLARIAQLPAVITVSARDTSVRIKHPLPRRNF